MTIRTKIYSAGAIIFVILIVLASTNIAMHLRVLQNLEVLDQVNHQLAATEEYEKWANDLNLLISDIVASGHVPRLSSQALEPPAEIQGKESLELAEHSRKLVDLVKEKENKTLEAQRRFDALRITINDLYYKLDKKIATVLAIDQMNRVMGKENLEESDLAPYVLKSLNQLTLIAMDTMISREFTQADRDSVDRNRSFLSTQLGTIDTDGSIENLFDKLFAQIDLLEHLLPEVDQAIRHFDTQIHENKIAFEEALTNSRIHLVVTQAASEVKTANEKLKNASRRTLIVAIFFLVGIPLMVIATGLWGLSRFIVQPITNLVSAMKDVERGNFDIEAPEQAQDEIGMLAKAFNAMARQIKTKVNDLALLNQTLEESEEQLKAVLESNASPIAVYDSKGCPTYLNPAFTELFGWTLDTLAGHEIPYVPQDQEELTKARFSEVQETGNPIRFQGKRLTEDGKTLDVIISAALISGSKAKGKGMVESLTDISEQIYLENQLRQAQKMEAVGQLAGGVAHDFNNILTAIFGNVELAIGELESQLPIQTTLLDGLHQIEQGAHRASSLTRQLLAFSRRQIIRPEVLDVNETIRNLEKMLSRLITEDIELKLNCDPKIQNVKADPGQLEQVIINLVVNARDAMKDGGLLTIDTQNVTLDEDYITMHPEVGTGPYVMLAVSDTGCGMEPDIQDRVFEPFFTTKKTGQGTGLGLSTVYGIIKQSGGSITVYSEPGKGTTFRAYLPAVQEAAVQPEHKQQEGPPPRGNETIIICEDDTAVRELAAHILREAGYAVFPMATPSNALQLAAEHNGQIDLLLTDVIMPEMNGKKLSDSLHEIRPEVRTLFVSGYTSNVIAHHGVLEENVEFLEKPYNRRQLLERVRSILDRKKREDTPPLLHDTGKGED